MCFTAIFCHFLFHYWRELFSLRPPRLERWAIRKAFLLPSRCKRSGRGAPPANNYLPKWVLKKLAISKNASFDSGANGSMQNWACDIPSYTCSAASTPH